MTSLIGRTLNDLNSWNPSYVDDTVEVFEPQLCISKFEDKEMRKCLAGKIFNLYNVVRAHKTKAAQTVHTWLEEDLSLRFEVSDMLAHKANIPVSKPLLKRPRHAPIPTLNKKLSMTRRENPFDRTA